MWLPRASWAWQWLYLVETSVQLHTHLLWTRLLPGRTGLEDQCRGVLYFFRERSNYISQTDDHIIIYTINIYCGQYWNIWNGTQKKFKSVKLTGWGCILIGWIVIFSLVEGACWLVEKCFCYCSVSNSNTMTYFYKQLQHI